MTRRKQPVLVGLPAVKPGATFFGLDRRDLERVVDQLNEKRKGSDGQNEPTPEAQALIRLIGRLKECGGNLQKMMNGDPELAQVVTKACTALWMPSKTGRAYLVLQPSWVQLFSPKQEQTRAALAGRYAAMFFHVWTLNPEWDKLAGPCARCGRYYLKKRASQDVYCSRRCGNAATALTRTRERIKAEHDDKMDRAKAARKDWKRAKTQQDWKRWVSQKTAIDLRFLSRNFTETGGVKSTTKEK